jgi:predicted glycosyltransferase
VLLYSHDGHGLGHLRRNLNIAHALLEQRPGAAVLLLAGLPGVPGVPLPAGADLIKLPSIRKVHTDRWQPRSLGVGSRRLNALRADLIAATARSYQPDLLVVDYLPAGMGHELADVIEALAIRGRTRIVLGLRDVLDDPEVTRRSWGHRRVRKVLGRYDRVLIYGDPDVIETATLYGLHDLFACPIAYTGYVGPARPSPDRARARRELSMDDGRRLVLVTAGGGADGYPLLSLVLRAVARLRAGPPIRTHILAGPLMDQDEYERLASVVVPGARLERSSDSLPTLIAAADVVVTMGSYNTLVEAIGQGRPVLCMPRPGPSAEQRVRAHLFEGVGLLRTIPARCSPDELAEMIVQALAGPPSASFSPRLDGRAHVARTLLDLMGESSLPRVASAVA